LASACLRIQTIKPIERPQLARLLKLRMNRPRWPAVDITIAGDTLSCRATTWEPLLRVRVEDALEEVLGSLWRDTIEWK
jgi:hypothetical protein